MNRSRSGNRRNVRNMYENPDYSSSTSLAHVILAGSAGWAVKVCSPSCPVLFWTLSFLFAHGLLGALIYSHPIRLDNIKRLYEMTTLIVDMMPLPALNYELLLIAKNSEDIALSHALSGFIPIVTQILVGRQPQNRVRNFARNVVLVGNVVTLMGLGVVYDAHWAGGLATLKTLNYFIFNKISESFDVPRTDMVVVGLAFYNIFAINAVSELKTSSKLF